MNLEFYDNKLHITYNIDDKNPSDKFIIKIQISRQNGEPVRTKSITGDLGDSINPGKNKTIIWDLEKDNFYINEDISVEISGEKLASSVQPGESISKSSLILMSAAVPGLGQTKMSGNPWWLGSFAAYGTLAGGFIIHKSSLDTYDKYKESMDRVKSEDLFDKAQKKLIISNTLFITSATLWVANIIWAAVSPDRNLPLKKAKVYLKPVTIPDNAGIMISLRVDF